jgi:tetratricopeptide (TPR) repeat protein
MFLMAIVAGTASIWTQRFFLEGIGSDPQWARTWPERLATAGDAVWFYLGKLLWPHPLITIYPRWQIPAAPWAPSLALLVMFVILSIFWLKRHAWSRACLFAFAYFLVALLPALGLFDNSIFRYSPVFDHLQYLASIGPLALAGAGLVVISNSIVPKERWLRSSMCVGLLIVLGMTSWQRIWVYESPETLWTDTLAKNPDCWICHSNLGDALLKKGKLDEAILEYRRALEIKPKDAEAHRDLGNVFLKEGKLDEAISEYQKALEIKPNFLGARSNLGGALFQKGQMDEAVEQFQKALELRPEKAAEAAVRYNLGIALSQKGQLNEALAQYQKSVEINPDYAEARNGLGVALAKKGQMYEAIEQFEEALRIRPDFSPAQDNLARARAMVRQSDGHE